MTGAERRRLRCRAEREQYVYVLAFGNGVLKVGQSRDGEKRVAQHRKEAARHSSRVIEAWVSPAHVDYESNEQRLISFCLKHYGEPVCGREYFGDADLVAVVKYAQTLQFRPLTEAELDDVAAEALRQTQAASVRVSAVQVAEIYQEVSLIKSLANPRNRVAASEAVYDAIRRMVAMEPAPWASADPRASRCYLTARAGRAVDSRAAREFEVDARTLFAVANTRFAETFGELADFMDGAR